MIECARFVSLELGTTQAKINPEDPNLGRWIVSFHWRVSVSLVGAEGSQCFLHLREQPLSFDVRCLCLWSHPIVEAHIFQSCVTIDSI